MKIKNKTNKSNFLKKIFIKLCRLLGFEIIDQSNFYLPISKKYGKENLSQIGKESLVIPMGRTKITRPIKSLDIILRTCASVNMLTQSKQRIFEKEKSEYSIKTLNSIINSINNSKQIFEKIKLKFTIIDHNSDNHILEKFNAILKKQFFTYEVINLDLKLYEKQINKINEEGKEVTKNQISNMSNIHQSLNIAKNCEDLIYFVEDDYLHKLDSLEEMIFTYEKISSQLDQELILCPADYPYLYNNIQNSDIFLGNKYHWRSIEETLCTFLTSSKLVNKHWDEFTSACKFEHYPFEKPFHNIYTKELCISPIPSLAVHFTNINSVYGLSPFVNYKKLWDENK
tara:strand:- start:408 stop:1433 length:1026 start_codon:yes stop_codon:yes gene_type:complete